MPLRASSIHGVSIPCLVPLTPSGTRPPIILADSSIVIGSGDAAQIRLKSLSVSKAHALVLVDDGRAYVRDLASRTELFVNEAAVREAVLKDGDVVRVGKFGFAVTEDPTVAAQGDRPRPPAPVVLLRVEDEAELRRVSEPVVLVGRRARCDISLADDSLSGAHAVMFRIGRRWFLRDLASRTGTYVNGAPIRQQRPLENGDTIRVGRADIRFLGEERITGYMTGRGEADAVSATTPIPSGGGPKVAAVPVATGNGTERVVARTVERQVASAEAPVAAAERATDVGMGTAGGAADVPVPPRVQPPAEAPPMPRPAPRIVDPPRDEPTRPRVDEGRIVGPGVAVSETATPLPAPRLVEHEPRGTAGMIDAVDAEDSTRPGTRAAPDGATAAAPAHSMSLAFHPVHEQPLEVHSRDAEADPEAASAASDEDWEQNVAVWSFEELAQRGLKEDEGEAGAPRHGRALIWAAVAVALVCVGVLGVVGYRLL